MSVDVAPFGDDAVRARLPAGIDGRALLEALRAQEGVRDAVVTEHHALVTFDPGGPPPDVAGVIARASKRGTGGEAGREHVVRVRYDGEDLEAVAQRLGLSPVEVVAKHKAPTYHVAVIGFLPGFAYLRGLDKALMMARRASPRLRVASGSVAIAGPYTGVYPLSSPGGWNIVGHALDFCGFDIRAGATLALGDRVRFVEDGEARS